MDCRINLNRNIQTLRRGKGLSKVANHFLWSLPDQQIATLAAVEHMSKFGYLFAACMKFRKTVISDGQEAEYPVYDHLNDAVNVTLCAKLDWNTYYAKECCNWECDKSGVHLFRLLEEEESMDESSLKIKWEQSDYVTMGETLMSRNAGSEKRKLQLAVKSTSPGKMVNYFKSPLSKFPYHQRRAKWQNKQMKILIENLPLDHVCCVHNYSEKLYMSTSGSDPIPVFWPDTGQHSCYSVASASSKWNRWRW